MRSYLQHTALSAGHQSEMARVDIAKPEAKYLIKIRMLCRTCRSNRSLRGLQHRAPDRDWEICSKEAMPGVQIVLPRFVDDPAEPGALCFCICQCDVDLQPL